jgi:hypothetical protein
MVGRLTRNGKVEPEVPNNMSFDSDSLTQPSARLIIFAQIREHEFEVDLKAECVQLGPNHANKASVATYKTIYYKPSSQHLKVASHRCMLVL